MKYYIEKTVGEMVHKFPEMEHDRAMTFLDNIHEIFKHEDAVQKASRPFEDVLEVELISGKTIYRIVEVPENKEDFAVTYAPEMLMQLIQNNLMFKTLQVTHKVTGIEMIIGQNEVLIEKIQKAVRS